MNNYEYVIEKAPDVPYIALFASNALWLWEWCQYDTESYEISTEGGGNANYIGEDGVIYNGEGESEEAGT